MPQDTNSCVICTLIYLAGIFTCESDVCRVWRPLRGVYHFRYPRAANCNAYSSQAARDVRASQEALVDIFERIENFFRRLAIYTQVPPTPEMVDIMIKIMVEVLSVLGTATNEIKQGRMSELSYKCMSRLIEWVSQKSF